MTLLRLAHLAAACSAFLLALSGAQAQGSHGPATHPFAASQRIPGRYIVVFKHDVTDPTAAAAGLMRGHGGQLHHVYSHALRGFAATLPDAARAAISQSPQVAYVEEDQTVSLRQTVEPVTQTQATWGLDRIDQSDLPLDSLYIHASTASNVHAFIIDTGIRADHADFGGRVRPGFTAISDGNGTEDCDGHGTHVAGTTGGATWGVAKGVALIPVRVLNCRGTGTASGVIAGIDWVAASPLRPAVANLSLGGGASNAMDAAVAGAVNRGVTMVVAAGNAHSDACLESPARVPAAITVAASAQGDARASYSNYGACVDLFAPGSEITSAWHTGPTDTGTISGTSMAAPHVAGVAALALAANPAASPAAVSLFLTANATTSRLSDVGAGSPNALVYSRAAGIPTEPPVQIVAVRSLGGSAVKVGADWQALVVVTVYNPSTLALVPNATVAASFAPGGATSCVTSHTGSCTLSSAKISRNNTSTTLGVTGLSGPSLSYDAGQNSVSQIVITSP